jgi:hypothetical protein
MIDDFRPAEHSPSQPEEHIYRQQPTAHTAAISGNHFLPAFGEPDFALPAHTELHEGRGLFARLRRLSKKQKIIASISGVAVCALIAGGAFIALRPEQKQSAVVVTKKASAGLPVDPAINKQQVTGVMIENSPEARPQSGLDRAGVVFEAIAEGGITRFLALYQDTSSDYIGPVRSVRPYYLQWCQGFDCAIAHVGGSPEALQNVKDWNVKNLDQFAGAGYFQRIGSRASPHNVYTSIAKLNAYEISRGYTASTFTGLDHLTKEIPIEPAAQNAKSINLNYPGSAYDVHYDYDAATNSYKRNEGGKPHVVVDGANSSTQLSPKVAVAIAVPRALQNDNKHNTYSVVGSGAAYVFQNGTATHGTWSKTAPAAPLTFVDDKGTPIKLNPGQAWISALDAIGDATFN